MVWHHVAHGSRVFLSVVPVTLCSVLCRKGTGDVMYTADIIPAWGIQARWLHNPQRYSVRRHDSGQGWPTPVPSRTLYQVRRGHYSGQSMISRIHREAHISKGGPKSGRLTPTDITAVKRIPDRNPSNLCLMQLFSFWVICAFCIPSVQAYILFVQMSSPGALRSVPLSPNNLDDFMVDRPRRNALLSLLHVSFFFLLVFGLYRTEHVESRLLLSIASQLAILCSPISIVFSPSCVVVHRMCAVDPRPWHHRPRTLLHDSAFIFFTFSFFSFRPFSYFSLNCYFLICSSSSIAIRLIFYPPSKWVLLSLSEGEERALVHFERFLLGVAYI